jgi:cytochrome c-type biogenesis protein CcmF
MKIAAIGGAIGAVAVIGFSFGRDLLAALFMAIGIWLIVGSILVLAQRVRLGFTPLSTSVRLLRTTPRAFYGLVIAHAGMGVLVVGIAGMSNWATEKIGVMRLGQEIELSGYVLQLRSIDEIEGPNYEAERGSFEITRNAQLVTRLYSERRFYPVRQQQTTVAGIHTNLISNVYVALGESDGAGGWTVRFYYHPLIPFVWIGALSMAFGGFLSLSDRRLRVGAPQGAARRWAAVPAQ